MNLQERELSIEHYRKLGLRDLEQLYTHKIIPHITQSLNTISALLKAGAEEKEMPAFHVRAVSLMDQFVQLYTDHAAKEVTLLSLLLNRKAGTLTAVIPQLKESHEQMRRLLAE